MLINDDWKIESNSLNVMLYRSAVNKKTGKKYWPSYPYGYYSNIKNALHALVEQGVKDTELASLEVLEARIDSLHNLIDSLPLPSR